MICKKMNLDCKTCINPFSANRKIKPKRKTPSLCSLSFSSASAYQFSHDDISFGTERVKTKCQRKHFTTRYSRPLDVRIAVQEERGPRSRREKISADEDRLASWNIEFEFPRNLLSFSEGHSGSNVLLKRQNTMGLNLSANSIYDRRYYVDRNATSLGRIPRELRPSRIMSAGTALQYEIAAQIFLASLRAARQHRDFSRMNMEEQNKILRRGWAAAFLLRAAIWPIDLADILGRIANSNDSTYTCLAAARISISNLCPDAVEISVLETCILCRPEITETSESYRLMSRARETAMDALIRHLEAEANSAQRLTKIMLILPILTGCCPRELASDLFAPIIGDLDLERVIASIR